MSHFVIKDDTWIDDGNNEFESYNCDTWKLGVGTVCSKEEALLVTLSTYFYWHTEGLIDQVYPDISILEEFMEKLGVTYEIVE